MFEKLRQHKHLMMCWYSYNKLNGKHNARAMEVSHPIILERALECIRFPFIWEHAHLSFRNLFSDIVGEIPK